MRSIRHLFVKEMPFFYACPAMLWQILFLYLPLLGILVFSFLSFETTADIISMLTIGHYVDILQPVYFKIIANSFVMALCTTVVTLLIAYPVAYFLAMYVKRMRMVLLFALILPSWTNFIVQMYAWFFLLEEGGFYSRVFALLGITAKPVSLFNNFPATILGMVYGFLPFMIFPLYVVLEKLDKRLIEASTDLGANRFQTFWRIYFPLSLPGVYAGVLLVFIPSFGEFAVPLLLGGAKRAYWGTVIMEKFLVTQDFASGFALATVGIVGLIGAMGALVFISAWIHRRRERAYKDFIMAGYNETGSEKQEHGDWGIYGR